MRESIGLAQVVGVTSCDHRPTLALGNVDGASGALALNLQAVVLNLNEETGIKQPRKPLRDLFRFIQLILEDLFGKLARGAPTETNQPFAVGCQKLFVDAR